MTSILYDIPSNGRARCWSPNTWKTRGALNLKGVDYKTEWLEYPDIAPKLKSFGLTPSDDNVMPFTCPVLQFPNGQVIMESGDIAVELEKQFPNTPSLDLDAPILQEVQTKFANILGPLSAVLLPKVPAILKPRSAEYFQRTRAERFGMPLADFERSEKGGENAWKAAEPHIKDLVGLLKKNADGPFFLGKTPSYADVRCLGMLQFAKEVGHGVFDRLVEHDDVLRALYQAGQPLLQRDD